MLKVPYVVKLKIVIIVIIVVVKIVNFVVREYLRAIVMIVRDILDLGSFSNQGRTNEK